MTRSEGYFLSSTRSPGSFPISVKTRVSIVVEMPISISPAGNAGGGTNKVNCRLFGNWSLLCFALTPSAPPRDVCRLTLDIKLPLLFLPFFGAVT